MKSTSMCSFVWEFTGHFYSLIWTHLFRWGWALDDTTDRLAYIGARLAWIVAHRLSLMHSFVLSFLQQMTTLFGKANEATPIWPREQGSSGGAVAAEANSNTVSKLAHVVWPTIYGRNKGRG